MTYLNREAQLNVELLQKMINRFRIDVEPKLNRNKQYYDGIQAILNKSYLKYLKNTTK